MKPSTEKISGVVAIVGRPNVGKSALFNRLLGRRLAIVHEESGVTRDRLVSDATWADRPYTLVDTGGLTELGKAASRDAITRATREQVFAALEDADVVIMVVDIQAGVQPLDLEVAQLLRESNCTVFVAANKSDTAQWEERMDEFMAMAYPVIPISASHNRGIEELMQAVISALPPGVQRERIARVRVAVVGRPNVGKSSFINRLIGENRLIVSDIPGTTRDNVEVPFTLGQGEHARHYTLIDTAGMRKQGRVHASVEKFSLFRARQSIAEADIVVLILDAVEGPTLQDKKIAAMIQEHHRGCLVLINKWDLAKGKKVTEREYEEALKKALFFLDKTPVVFVSALSGYNIRHCFQVIEKLSDKLDTEIPTGVLNRLLHDAFHRTQPPAVKGKALKFYYATQTGRRPPRLMLFVNQPELCRPQYQAYLKGILARAMDLEGVPVVLAFKSSHGRSAGER